MANFTLDQTGQEIQDILDTVGNNQATQGQVLTANGSGGASWQNASGEKSYLHKLQINNTTLYANITTKSQTTFTIESLRQYIYDMMGANRPLYCLFKIQQNGNIDYTIYYGLQATSSNLKLSGSSFGYSIDFSAQTFANKSISSPTGNISALTDNVIEL